MATIGADSAEFQAGKVITIPGNLVLKRDTVFNGPLEVAGCIVGKHGKRHDLTVKGYVRTQADIHVRNLIAEGDVSAGGSVITENKIIALGLEGVCADFVVCRDIVTRHLVAKFLVRNKMRGVTWDDMMHVAEELINSKSALERREIKVETVNEQLNQLLRRLGAPQRPEDHSARQ